jgi:hypothetical protein
MYKISLSLHCAPEFLNGPGKIMFMQKVREQEVMVEKQGQKII